MHRLNRACFGQDSGENWQRAHATEMGHIQNDARARPALLAFSGRGTFGAGVATLAPSTYAHSSFCRRKSTNALSAKLFPPSMPSFPCVLYASDMGMRTRGVKCRAILFLRRRNESELYQLQELVLKCSGLRCVSPVANLHGMCRRSRCLQKQDMRMPIGF